MVTDSITWAAHRVDDDGLEAARALIAALGLKVFVDEPDKIMAATERGDVLEYCGPRAEVPAHLFTGGSSVIGFRVDDLEAAATALRDAGLRPHAAIVDAGAVRFQHFAGPGGVTFGLIAAA